MAVSDVGASAVLTRFGVGGKQMALSGPPVRIGPVRHRRSRVGCIFGACAPNAGQPAPVELD
jgi:hypothetical protein